MPDFNNPLSTQGYLALLASIVENNQSAIKLLDGVTPLTNLPVGAKRWNATNSRFENWNGTAWEILTSLFEMKVRNADQLNAQTADYYLNAGNLNAGTLPAARFADSTHGNRSGGSLHALATTTIAGFMSPYDKNKIDGIEAGATADMTGAEILSALLGVDGAGSGLDTDTVDGIHAAALLDRANHTGTQSYATITGLGSLSLQSLLDQSDLPAISGTGLYLDGAVIHRTLAQWGGGTGYVMNPAFTVKKSGTITIKVKADNADKLGNMTWYIRKNGANIAGGYVNDYSIKTVTTPVNVNDTIEIYSIGGGGAEGSGFRIAVAIEVPLITTLPNVAYDNTFTPWTSWS